MLLLPDEKSGLIRKDPEAGKDWRQEEKETTEDEMVGWHHWLDGHKFEQVLGDGEGQGSLACCSPWGHKESDRTEQLNSNNNCILGTSQVAQMVKHLPAMWEVWVWSLGWEDPLEKEMATHSSILAWKIPLTEEPGRLQSMGSQRVGHDWVTSLHLHTCCYLKQPFKVSRLFILPMGKLRLRIVEYLAYTVNGRVEIWTHVTPAQKHMLFPSFTSTSGLCVEFGSSSVLLLFLQWKNLNMSKIHLQL